MKLPNGYGSVYKLSGKRRNPWVARKTTGWTLNVETKKSFPVYQFVGYYPTQKEALQALADYNKDPYDLYIDKITFGELYDRFSDKWTKRKTPRIQCPWGLLLVWNYQNDSSKPSF
ncbi:MAG: hypothetical protein PHR06_15055 [Candidatus Cloacimonetes bacterium]|nr:hypothetical protein [Candidatus Cloacimonadota bacterium]